MLKSIQPFSLPQPIAVQVLVKKSLTTPSGKIKVNNSETIDPTMHPNNNTIKTIIIDRVFFIGIYELSKIELKIYKPSSEPKIISEALSG